MKIRAITAEEADGQGWEYHPSLEERMVQESLLANVHACFLDWKTSKPVSNSPVWAGDIF